jgi:hypothetical protein
MMKSKMDRLAKWLLLLIPATAGLALGILLMLPFTTPAQAPIPEEQPTVVSAAQGRWEENRGDGVRLFIIPDLTLGVAFPYEIPTHYSASAAERTFWRTLVPTVEAKNGETAHELLFVGKPNAEEPRELFTIALYNITEWVALSTDPDPIVADVSHDLEHLLIAVVKPAADLPATWTLPRLFRITGIDPAYAYFSPHFSR